MRTSEAGTVRTKEADLRDGYHFFTRAKMEQEDAPDPYVRDFYCLQASNHVRAGRPLRQALAVHRPSPCEDELVAELIRAALPLAELHQAMHGSVWLSRANRHPVPLAYTCTRDCRSCRDGTNS
jgi:hypothetical protein